MALCKQKQKQSTENYNPLANQDQVITFRFLNPWFHALHVFFSQKYVPFNLFKNIGIIIINYVVQTVCKVVNSYVWLNFFVTLRTESSHTRISCGSVSAQRRSFIRCRCSGSVKVCTYGSRSKHGFCHSILFLKL